MKIDLTGQWLFKATSDDAYMNANVPGCQYLDLMANGIIEDPFVGTNEALCDWIHDNDYEYLKEFHINPDNLQSERIELNCQCLDTICELFINDQRLGYADNCHIPHVFDVKQFLREGNNQLKIIFKSPKQYVIQKYSEVPTPVNSNGQDGIVHIRKPQCHFGWDWGPVLTPVGISGRIYLEFTPADKLGDLIAHTEKRADSFVVLAHCDNADQLELIYPDGKTYISSGPDATFTVTHPCLWWTYELSGKDEQPLYTLNAKKKYSDTDTVCIGKKIGLRTIELNQEKDEFGYNFQFILNGVPIFAKGANYIPPDSFMNRFTAKQRAEMLDAVRFSNMNMLRIWGGGYYADEELLDECDRRGILIWQDFMFACQAYPFFIPEFLNNVTREIEHNVQRIMSHPCLALWCGNNEIEESHARWAHMKTYVEWTEKFFYHIMPDIIRRHDTITPYIPGSPFGTAHNTDVYADFVGDTHLWGVWHGLQPMHYYRGRMTRFCSEFGFESLPCFKTVQKYATPEQYPLSSDVQKSHQKCLGGNDKMLHYIASRFYLSDDIEDLIYLSQITQQECIADATEHWRRNKGRCNGSLFWQLNDCWPTCSWSSYDYFGQYKALQYKARHFNAPVSISIQDEKRDIKIYLLNDLNNSAEVEIEYIIFSFDGEYRFSERKDMHIDALKNLLAFTIPAKSIKARHQGLAVRLYQKGILLMQKTHLMLPEKKLSLPKHAIETHTEVKDGKLKIHLTSPVYQRLIMLENDSDGHFSDNFFDLLPNESRTIEQKYSDGAENIRIRTAATLKRSKYIKDLIARAKVYFSLNNLSLILYYIRAKK